MHDDSELIAEALAGKGASFGLLVEKYQDRLYTTMSHVTGSPHEARDVVQEAFVQAFVKLSQYQGSSAFYTWLYRIAFNAAVSRRRRRRPTMSVEQIREINGSEPVDAGPRPEERLERTERVTQVQAALAALSDEHRSVLVLREIEGFDYDAIAEMLHMPIGTVRSRIHRARLQLKDHLKRVMHEDVNK